MSPAVAEALTRVSEELEVQIGLLEREGVRYSLDYMEYVVAGRPGNSAPTKPAGMQAKVAGLIRELAMDELTAMRRGLA